MIDRKPDLRIAAFDHLGLPVEPHAGDRWLVLRKLTIFVVVAGVGVWAAAAVASLRGRDFPVSTVVIGLGAVFAVFGMRYLSGFAQAYRVPRDERQLVGVNFTPDGLSDALFETTALPRPLSPVTTAAFVTVNDVSVMVGGQMFNLTRSDLYEVRLGVAPKKVWLLIEVGQQEFALRLRGPVLGESGRAVPRTRDSDEHGAGDGRSST